ncbi:hypothetical protein EDD85DRAFT_783839 [Armillaria nabsnona]|nr:hypothetical protein EDD85DRAFT_783839 [Armillaria nabsnona]
MEINIDNGLGLSTKDLTDKGFIQLTGFQLNSTFNSLRNSPATRREPLLSDSQWRKGKPCLTVETQGQSRPMDDDICPTTETWTSPVPTPAQVRPAVSPVTAIIPLLSRQEKPVVISSDDNDNDSKYTLMQKEVKNLLDDEAQVRMEVLTDLGGMTTAKTAVARAFADGQARKAFKQLGFTDVPSDLEEFILEYNANLATILIGRSFLAPENVGTRSMLTKAVIHKHLEKGKKRATTWKLDKEIPTKRAPPPDNIPKEWPTIAPEIKVKKPETKVPSLMEDKMCIIKEKVTYQRIRNSQIRDGMRPTIPNQEIIFDKNNNPWLKLDFAENNMQMRQTSKGQRVHNHSSRPPNDGGDPDDDNDDNDNKGNGKQDPFTPRPWPRGTSATPSSQSIEGKIRDQEHQYQKIIDFI